MKPHWQDRRERLRRKLLSRGAGRLDNYEIPEVLLMVFVARRNARPIAKTLTSLSGELAVPFADLIKFDGIDKTVAACLKAIAQLPSRAARGEISKHPDISSWSALTNLCPQTSAA